jgi:hypothetical protein
MIYGSGPLPELLKHEDEAGADVANSRGGTTMTSRKTGITWILTTAAAGMLLVGNSALGSPQERTPPPPTAGQNTTNAIVPDTPDEHLAKAESYRAKAIAYRKEAAEHRKMLADYKRQSPPTGKFGESPYVKKMRVHCEKYIAEAEALAAEAEKLAEYHTLRAAELKGQ